MLNPETLARLAAQLQQPGLSEADRITTLHQYASLVQKQTAAADAMAEKLLQQLAQAGAWTSSSPQYETQHGAAFNAGLGKGSTSELPAKIIRQEPVAAAKALIGQEQQLQQVTGALESFSAIEMAKSFLTGQLQQEGEEKEEDEDECIDQARKGGQVWIGYHHQQQRQQDRAVGASLPLRKQQQQQQHQALTLDLGSCSPRELRGPPDAVPYRWNQGGKLRGKPALAPGRIQGTPPAAAPSPAPPTFNMVYGEPHAPFMGYNPASDCSSAMLLPAMLLGVAEQQYGTWMGEGVRGVMSTGMLGPWPGASGAADAGQVEGRAGAGVLINSAAASAGFAVVSGRAPAADGSYHHFPLPSAPADVTAEASGSASTATVRIGHGPPDKTADGFVEAKLMCRGKPNKGPVGADGVKERQLGMGERGPMGMVGGWQE
jgi:hypothetical protein